MHNFTYLFIWYCEIIINKGYWRWQRASLRKTLNKLLPGKTFLYISLWTIPKQYSYWCEKKHKYILWQHDFVNKFYFSPHRWLEFLFLLFLFFSHVFIMLEFPEKKILPGQHEKWKKFWEGVTWSEITKRTSINKWKHGSKSVKVIGKRQMVRLVGQELCGIILSCQLEGSGKQENRILGWLVWKGSLKTILSNSSALGRDTFH